MDKVLQGWGFFWWYKAKWNTQIKQELQLKKKKLIFKKDTDGAAEVCGKG